MTSVASADAAPADIGKSVGVHALQPIVVELEQPSADAELIEKIILLLDRSAVWRFALGAVKAMVIGLMFAVGAAVAKVSLLTVFEVFAVFTLVAMFNIWRRFLEPLAFATLMVAMAAICFPAPFARLAMKLGFD